MYNQYYQQGNNYYNPAPVLQEPFEMEHRIESDYIANESKRHGGYLLTLQVAMSILSIFFSFVAASIFKTDAVEYAMVVSVFVYLAAYISTLLLYNRKKSNWLKNLISPKNSNWKFALNFKGIFYMSIFIIGINAIISFLTNLLMKLLDSQGIKIFSEELFGTSILDKNPLTIAATVFAMVIIAPFFEEIIFRGIILKPLRRYGDKFAIIVSAVLFSLMHGNLVQIPFSFAAGLMLGYITVKTNSIFPAMVLHFINNLYAVAMQMVSEGILSNPRFLDPEKSLNVASIFTGVIMVIEGILALYAIYKLITRKKWVNYDDIEAIPKTYQPKNKAGIYFSSGYMIAFIVIMLITVSAVVLMSTVDLNELFSLV